MVTSTDIYVTEGVLRGTKTKTDGRVPRYGYTLDDILYGRAKHEDSVTMFHVTTQ
jgi:hypothetical protein